MDLELTHGLTVGSIQVCGRPVVSMVKANTNLVLQKILRRDFGLTENVKNGFERILVYLAVKSVFHMSINLFYL